MTAVAIQGSTGGNLGEILENLSGVIRQRFKMRRKIRAFGSRRARLRHHPVLAADCHFLIILLVAPDFYASVWNESMIKTALAVAGCWMGIVVRLYTLLSPKRSPSQI